MRDQMTKVAYGKKSAYVSLSDSTIPSDLTSVTICYRNSV